MQGAQALTRNDLVRMLYSQRNMRELVPLVVLEQTADLICSINNRCLNANRGDFNFEYIIHKKHLLRDTARLVYDSCAANNQSRPNKPDRAAFFYCGLESHLAPRRGTGTNGRGTIGAIGYFYAALIYLLCVYGDVHEGDEFTAMTGRVLDAILEDDGTLDSPEEQEASGISFLLRYGPRQVEHNWTNTLRARIQSVVQSQNNN